MLRNGPAAMLIFPRSHTRLQMPRVPGTTRVVTIVARFRVRGWGRVAGVRGLSSLPPVAVAVCGRRARTGKAVFFGGRRPSAARWRGGGEGGVS